METVPSSISIDSLKRHLADAKQSTSLNEYFQRTYTDGDQLDQVRDNFVVSMAGYSLFCYLLAIRDRHNGNILLDASGHVVHVDYGFMFSNSPGNVGLEPVPGFKLTRELVEVMGGADSAHFKKFENLLVQGFLAVRQEYRQLMALIEMSVLGEEDLPCFSSGRRKVLEQLRGRFQLELTQTEADVYMRKLIKKCTFNWRGRAYDTFQRVANGIQ